MTFVTAPSRSRLGNAPIIPSRARKQAVTPRLELIHRKTHTHRPSRARKQAVTSHLGSDLKRLPRFLVLAHN